MCFMVVTNNLFDSSEADIKSEANYLHLQTKLLEDEGAAFEDFSKNRVHLVADHATKTFARCNATRFSVPEHRTE